MKLLLLLALITTSASSFAAKDVRVSTDSPTAQFYFKRQIKFIPITSVCKIGNQLETIKAYNLCVEYKRENPNNRHSRQTFDCLKYEKRKMVTDVEYTRKKCVSYNNHRNSNGRRTCARYEEKTYQYPTSFKLTTRKQRWIGNQDTGHWGWPGKVLSKTNFTVPHCE
jgi:hypothetical protein